MSTELSDLGELHRALSATVQLEKVERKAALAAHTMATKRIFPASGVSKDSNNRPLGVYSKSTMAIRKKKGWGNRGVNLQFTRQLIHAWNVVEQAGTWVSLFLISGRRGSRLSNDEVADKLEDQYTTLGHIFDKTKEEEEYHAKMLEKYQGELLNK